MLTIDELRAEVGEVTWGMAKREAWESAPETGTRENFWRFGDLRPFSEEQLKARGIERRGDFAKTLDEVLDRLEDSIESDHPANVVVERFLSLYLQLPSYGLLFRLLVERPLCTMDSATRAAFWSFVRTML